MGPIYICTNEYQINKEINTFIEPSKGFQIQDYSIYERTMFKYASHPISNIYVPIVQESEYSVSIVIFQANPKYRLNLKSYL